MKLASKSKFYAGITIIALLAISYFIKIKVDVGSNYEITDSLLGIIIFHSPIALIIYIAIAGILMSAGVKRIKLV